MAGSALKAAPRLPLTDPPPPSDPQRHTPTRRRDKCPSKGVDQVPRTCSTRASCSYYRGLMHSLRRMTAVISDARSIRPSGKLICIPLLYYVDAFYGFRFISAYANIHNIDVENQKTKYLIEQRFNGKTSWYDVFS